MMMMKKKEFVGSDGSGNELPELKKRQRHIVSWSSEEDEVLREQIRLHGTENWVAIASKFKDKSTRQCRRRWFTYLNSDFKRGGWSPEEDMLLCEAQKIFGNRWTEIAKVVSGRTDNAVKNRFTTLCKKRAKHEEALAKESNGSPPFINSNSNNPGTETAPSLKRMRWSETAINRQENADAADNLHALEKESLDAESRGSQGAFLTRDDPKLLALMEQAELLSSLAIKVNSEQTDQSLEDAWMALQEFLRQNKQSNQPGFGNPDTDCQLEKFSEFGSSLASSEYSTGSTLPSSDNRTKESRGEIRVPQQENSQEFETDQFVDQHFIAGNGAEVYECHNTEFDSPVHVAPLFRALAAAIPSPKFSESEKHFLLKTLGMEPTSPRPIPNPSQPPTCKRSLLHCL